jgi:hypothetical protein
MTALSPLLQNRLFSPDFQILLKYKWLICEKHYGAITKYSLVEPIGIFPGNLGEAL